MFYLIFIELSFLAFTLPSLSRVGKSQVPYK